METLPVRNTFIQFETSWSDEEQPSLRRVHSAPSPFVPSAAGQEVVKRKTIEEHGQATDSIQTEKEAASNSAGKKRKVNADGLATCENTVAFATVQAVYPILFMQPISMCLVPQMGSNKENEPQIHVVDYAADTGAAAGAATADCNRERSRTNNKRDIEERLRHEKRDRYVKAIMKTPGFKAYCASMDRGEARALKVPAKPNASDSSLSKRQWDELCRKWRTALKQFGEIPLSLSR